MVPPGQAREGVGAGRSHRGQGRMCGFGFLRGRTRPATSALVRFIDEHTDHRVGASRSHSLGATRHLPLEPADLGAPGCSTPAGSHRRSRPAAPTCAASRCSRSPTSARPRSSPPTATDHLPLPQLPRIVTRSTSHEFLLCQAAAASPVAAAVDGLFFRVLNKVRASRRLSSLGQVAAAKICSPRCRAGS